MYRVLDAVAVYRVRDTMSKVVYNPGLKRICEVDVPPASR
jgi:hypothetical protein